MESERTQLEMSKILLRNQTKMWEKIAKRKTISWTMATLFISIFVGYVYSFLPSLLIAMIDSMIISVLLLYALNSWMDGRVEVRGMKSPYIIVFGIVILLWCGGLFSNVYHLNELVLIILAFVVGLACVYIGFKKGPVHGWE